MQPYDGTSVVGVDRSTLTGKVMCGYQGWFDAPGDGSGRGWAHYRRRGNFQPGQCTIDLWPDVSDLDEDEKFATDFRHADGSVAYVFSLTSARRSCDTSSGCKEYGIDGVFVQRFAVETRGTTQLHHCNTVLANCRAGRTRHGRAYAVMYDLSGLGAGQMQRVKEDWKLLVDRMRIGRDDKDQAYLHHNGKPVVAVWGIGFNDGRRYTLGGVRELVEFLTSDKRYGGFT